MICILFNVILILFTLLNNVQYTLILSHNIKLKSNVCACYLLNMFNFITVSQNIFGNHKQAIVNKMFGPGTTCDISILSSSKLSQVFSIFSGTPEINNSAIFSTYKLCYRISENATQQIQESHLFFL